MARRSNVRREEEISRAVASASRVGKLALFKQSQGRCKRDGGVSVPRLGKGNGKRKKGKKCQTFYAQIQADGTDGQFVPIKKERY